MHASAIMFTRLMRTPQCLKKRASVTLLIGHTYTIIDSLLNPLIRHKIALIPVGIEELQSLMRFPFLVD